MGHVVALFGEAEKGQYHIPYHLKELPQLVDLLGHPPEESQGLFFAVQSLLFQRELIFFRVENEGFSVADYFNGLKVLEDKNKIKRLHAICLPGVGDEELLKASQNVCEVHQSFLITTEKDLYDYLTWSQS
jgi:hypothetical protein